MAKTRRPANRTMPAADPTGRRPPKQARPARNQSKVPGAGPIRQVKVTGRDPRHGHHGPRVPSPTKNYR
jgi:hypothetical protein